MSNYVLAVAALHGVLASIVLILEAPVALGSLVLSEFDAGPSHSISRSAFSILVQLGTIYACVDLVRARRWVRIFMIVTSTLAIFTGLVDAILSIYSLWVLTSLLPSGSLTS